MNTVFVRAGKDRIAFADEAGKKRIPNDRYIRVQASNWINRLLAHGDIELKPEPPIATQAIQVASEPAAQTSRSSDASPSGSKRSKSGVAGNA